MAENIITNSDDVELLISSADGANQRGSSGDYGRIVVDDFSITKEEDVTSHSGVGSRTPTGISLGDVEHSFSFTLMGDDVELWRMVGTSDGTSRPISIVAKTFDEQGDLQWKYRLDTCYASSEELSMSSGDPVEYAVEGMAVDMTKEGGSNGAWPN